MRTYAVIGHNLDSGYCWQQAGGLSIIDAVDLKRDMERRFPADKYCAVDEDDAICPYCGRKPKEMGKVK